MGRSLGRRQFWQAFELSELSADIVRHSLRFTTTTTGTSRRLVLVTAIMAVFQELVLAAVCRKRISDFIAVSSSRSATVVLLALLSCFPTTFPCLAIMDERTVGSSLFSA
ncbi:hypothetical protein IW262DRAFT_848665 [Armillaria fumosa]|nr:hypothetical protein IW262DRAFT_848665 [Armillaria fumosa]